MNRKFMRKPQQFMQNGGSEQRSENAAAAHSQNDQGRKSNMQGISNVLNGSAEGNMPTETGECVVCGNAAICVCQRCGDYYCSPQCQRQDWPKHRYICFPMPSLVHPKLKATTDNVYGVETPLLTAARISNEPLENQQRILNDIFRPEQPRNAQQQGNANAGTNNKNAAPAYNKQQKRQEPMAVMQASAPPKTNSRVMLTGFRTPNRCYVRSLTSSDNDDYLLCARKIDSYGKSAPTLKTLPQPHSYAIAELNGVMCRVEILMARSRESIRVLFCDRGVTGTRRQDELREITNDIIRLQQHAVMVPLRNVSNFALNNQLLDYLTQFEDMEFKLKCDPKGDRVELLHWQNEKSLNDEIERHCKEVGALIYQTGDKNNDSTTSVMNATTGSAEVAHDEQFYAVEDSGSQKSTSASNSGKSAARANNAAPMKNQVEKVVTPVTEKAAPAPAPQKSVEQPILKAPFETKLFELNSGPFKAVVVDVSCLEYGYIGCVAQADWPHFSAVYKEILSIEVPDTPYTPKLNEYCIAQFEEQWYRAKVIDMPDAKHFTVMYVDFTNESTVTSADIRRFPAGLRSDCRTNLCLLDGLPSELSEELVTFLNKEIPLQCEVTIDKVKEIDEQIIVIECRSLKEKLSKMLH